jgi:nucleoside-diphosphate-sugar epimerase
MHVFVTGASGYIGIEVIRALHNAGHTTTSLTRNKSSQGLLTSMGSRALLGDMKEPISWKNKLDSIDGAIHLAATLGKDMSEADAAALTGLLEVFERKFRNTGRRYPLVYTGGLWLYGPVGDQTAVEGSSFVPPPEFTFMVEHRDWLFQSPHISARVVHPAMVWDEQGGAIADFLKQAKSGNAPIITGNANVRWPLVHRADLARLYVAVLENGQDSHDYHGVAECGVPVGKIAGAISKRFASPDPVVMPVDVVIKELGSWAACRAYDQTMDAPFTRSALSWLPKQKGILETVRQLKLPDP